MKKTLVRLLFIVCMFSLPANALARQKVLLDADMVEAFDDGIAMLMLAAAPSIDLIGVTTVSGNSWVEAGTAFTIRQLELAGKKNIPVAMGAEFPLRANRHETLEAERILFGIGHDVWLGSFGLPKPQSWQEFYEKHYKTKPSFAPIKQHAVDFIIESVRKYPHELTIAAIGPCTNLALAIRKAPDIIPLIKRVIYMGGAFFQPGNVTPAAEYNWWFDPEAARMSLRAPFREQIMVGLDVAEDIEFTWKEYERVLKTLGGNTLADMLEKSHVGVSFGKNKKFSHFVWDVIVSAILIDPRIIAEETVHYVDVNDAFGLSYGQSLAYPKNGPAGAQKARIILEINEDRFWDMVNDARYWKGIAP